MTVKLLNNVADTERMRMCVSVCPLFLNTSPSKRRL